MPTGQFKNYNRTQRTQTTEELYTKGMVSTNAPQLDGSVQLLVNYDLESDGNSIKTRQGLNASALCDAKLLSTDYSPDKFLVTAKECIEADNIARPQIITGVCSAITTAKDRLYKGAIECNTPLEGELHVEALTNAYFNKPQGAAIHGVPLAEEINIAAHVGAFGFNNSYYCFSGDKLQQTTKKEADNHYSFEEVEPRGTTPKEAAMWGYNMLAEDPYHFECLAGAGAMTLTGLLPYTKEGELVMTPKMNDDIVFKAFYSAPVGAQYKITWEWKEPTGAEWSTIKEQMVTINNELEPFEIEFSCPVPATIIRLNAYRNDPDSKPIGRGEHNHRDSAFKYSGSWTNADEWHYSGTKEAKVEFTILGTGLKVKGYKNVDRGKFEIDIDGYKTVVDCYEKSKTEVVDVYINEYLVPGEHKVTITVLGEKNTASTSYWVNFGSIEVMERIESTPLPEQTLAVGFNFNKEDYKDTNNAQAKKYRIQESTGMCYWRNRLVLWGTAEDPTLLFCSEVNNPGYFPYPNNTDVFGEPIIHAVPLLDKLLVFTTNSLYSLTLSPDGMSWNKALIQANLTIKPWDTHLIRPVKNMVFFKSGNYYYMVVPKATSLTGELTIAPVSKPITSYLDKFKTNVAIILERLYNYTEDFELAHYYNYLDYEDIHNVYSFKISDVYFNIVLLYNIVTRHWRVYCYESNSIYKPYKQDATAKGELLGVVPIANKLGFAKVEYNPNAIVDTCVDTSGLTQETKKFKSYQMLDTGYREISSDYKKRFRELQIRINNKSQSDLNFYTNFVVDGDMRLDHVEYETVHNIDPSNPDYGTITVQRKFINSEYVPGSTTLNEAGHTNGWKMDMSVFPDVTLWKVRIPVSGKGYNPRMLIISLNQKPYEIISTAYVYRTLYSR